MTSFPALTTPPAPSGVPVPYPNFSSMRTSGDQVLLFDEADALFGRRTEVR